MIRLVCLSSILVFLSSFNNGNEPDIKDFIADDIDFLVGFYKNVHQNPEISLREKNTAKSLATELKSIGFEVTENFGGYGVVGIFKNGDGPQTDTVWISGIAAACQRRWNI